ncbi:MAG: hypothetical protein LAT75_02725 [Candidatus Cyclonatronum sp.]|uniref:hypothetical protein n=1 Tax=Cyclonatronum sp. TaxID=3024185 RepID=UPI0025C02DA5|nr:hypothetical protein [Cyclonatronum sp.]MCC5933076.1 hypothetical protein [Balneolales bacterium]MCH8485750.1 hypothetical protein [Cyclonatronum sp.]
MIKKIETELGRRNINPSKFRVWNDPTINAAGLELALEPADAGCGVREITVNLDWDSFREAKLANQLEGMAKHPLLKKRDLLSSKVPVTIDIETAWHFDEQQIIDLPPNGDADARISYASSWMNSLNQEMAFMLQTGKLLHRWHIEVDGDQHGKYISAMALLLYHQYSFRDAKNLSEVHDEVSIKLDNILRKSSLVLDLARKTRPVAA